MLVVLTTAPDADAAARIAKTLVEEKLAACVNLVPGVRSIYRWEGKLCDDAEVLLVAKVRADRFDAYAERMRALHPYEVPEIVALPVERVARSYLRFVLDSGS